MTVSLNIEALHSTFFDVEKLIYHTVHAFIRCYGGDFDDLLQEAYEGYHKAYVGYQPGRSLFSARVRFKVWHHLLEQRRRRAMKREAQFTRHDLHDNLPASHHFDLREFRSELSSDARTVLRLVFDSHTTREPNVPRIRDGVQKTLEDMGWTVRQIADTFWEITQALQ